jgi:hypothetical protein
VNTRARIAAALSQIDGVSGHVAAPRTPLPGAAWPVLRSAAPGTLGGGLARSYDVFLVLSATSPEATAQGAEEYLEPFAGALLDVGPITWPVELVTVSLDDAGPGVPALRARVDPYDD